ncbi:hypothetical protein WKI40_18385 [Kosakonia sacchari]|uniref:hypothetical protein n=1 Tax=Kosakonia sacchari TaxID=1158459 RepID=UPI0030BAA074
MMQEIQAIQASPHLATTKENTNPKSAAHTDSGAANSASHDESTKVTLSSRAEKHKHSNEIKAEQQVQEKKKVENHEIDYSLAMTGIPQFGGRLVTIVKYPDGRTEMVDAFSGKKVTQQELATAQLQKEQRVAEQHKLDAKVVVQQEQVTAGESEPTDMQ